MPLKCEQLYAQTMYFDLLGRELGGEEGKEEMWHQAKANKPPEMLVFQALLKF